MIVLMKAQDCLVKFGMKIIKKMVVIDGGQKEDTQQTIMTYTLSMVLLELLEERQLLTMLMPFIFTPVVELIRKAYLFYTQ